ISRSRRRADLPRGGGPGWQPARRRSDLRRPLHSVGVRTGGRRPCPGQLPARGLRPQRGVGRVRPGPGGLPERPLSARKQRRLRNRLLQDALGAGRAGSGAGGTLLEDTGRALRGRAAGGSIGGVGRVIRSLLAPGLLLLGAASDAATAPRVELVDGRVSAELQDVAVADAVAAIRQGTGVDLVLPAAAGPQRTITLTVQRIP